MRWPFEVMSAVAALVIAGCTIHYFTTFFIWPEYAAAQEDDESERRRTLLGKWLFYGYVIAAFIGTLFCVHQGVATALHWIPQSWVNFIDDGGNREGGAFTPALLVAFYAAAGLLSGLSKLSRRIVNDGTEIERLRWALNEARKSNLK